MSRPLSLQGFIIKDGRTSKDIPTNQFINIEQDNIGNSTGQAIIDADLTEDNPDGEYTSAISQ